MRLTLKSILSKINWYGLMLVIYSLWIMNTRLRDKYGFDDFNIFYDAGRRLLNQENIYGEPYFLGMYRYYYSVFFAYIMALLQNIDLVKAKTIWFVFNYLAMIRILLILRTCIFKELPYSKVLFVILLLITGKIVLYNFLSNQLTILLTWIILESFIQVTKGNILLPALLLSIGINFKILPLAVFPWILYICNKRMRFLFMTLASMLFMVYFPAFIIGWEQNNYLIGEWLKTINPISRFHLLQVSEGGMLDISSMGTKYVTDEAVRNEPNINFLTLNAQGLFIVVNLIRSLLTGLVIFAASRIKHPVLKMTPPFLILIAFMTLIPLCFPHQRLYSYLLALPMLAALLVITINRGTNFDKILLIILVLLSGFLAWNDFTGDRIVDFFNLYRLPTIGTMLLLFFYIYLLLKIQKNLQEDPHKLG